ncbi:hypothetical protein JS562_54505, partial [Agrobacterium sp. S2]|nr:hypothetical protein [Agrobacterium sp. S2]
WFIFPMAHFRWGFTAIMNMIMRRWLNITKPRAALKPPVCGSINGCMASKSRLGYLDAHGASRLLARRTDPHLGYKYDIPEEVAI